MGCGTGRLDALVLAAALLLTHAHAARAQDGGTPGGSSETLRYDLASLAVLADDVVIARKGSHDARGTWRVVRVLAGTLVDGARLSLGDTPSRASLPDDTLAFLFLRREAGGSRSVIPGGRLVERGADCGTPPTVAYEAEWNGSWAPDGVGAWGSAGPIVNGSDTSALGAELDVVREALRRADIVRDAARPSPAEERRNTLLALLEPIVADRFAVDRTNVLARRVEAALLAAGDLGGAALARSRDRSWRPRPPLADAHALARLGLDTRTPLDERVAALRALADDPDADETLVDALARLLAERDAHLRAAAGAALSGIASRAGARAHACAALAPALERERRADVAYDLGAGTCVVRRSAAGRYAVRARGGDRSVHVDAVPIVAGARPATLEVLARADGARRLRPLAAMVSVAARDAAGNLGARLVQVAGDVELGERPTAFLARLHVGREVRDVPLGTVTRGTDELVSITAPP